MLFIDRLFTRIPFFPLPVFVRTAGVTTFNTSELSSAAAVGVLGPSLARAPSLPPPQVQILRQKALLGAQFTDFPACLYAGGAADPYCEVALQLAAQRLV